MRWAGHVARMGSGMDIGYWREGQKQTTVKPRHRLADGIKMNLREIGWGSMDWIDLAQDREHGDEPSGSIKCWGILE